MTNNSHQPQSTQGKKRKFFPRKKKSQQSYTAQTQSSALPSSPTKETQVPKKPNKGIYLLPNAFTTTALFCGFYAIVMAMNQRFENAGLAIFVAMVFDSLDGRVARMTHTQSEFGAQYDSLSDMISFGAAPALIVYEWALKGMGKLGWLAAFMYCAGAALRLARFNANIGVVDKRYFQGLPSPASAALVAGFVLLMVDLNLDPLEVKWLAFTITLVAGLTMVSNIPFYSFKDINLKKSVPFVVPLVLVMIYIAVVSDPPKILFGIFITYLISGYAVFVWRWVKGQQVSLVETQTRIEEEDAEGANNRSESSRQNLS